MVTVEQRKIRDNQRYADNRDQIRERKRLYRLANFEKVKQQNKESYLRCREQRLLDMKEYKKRIKLLFE